EAAAAGEKRPFPRRILFTGWFHTGRQGKEWPGSFDIVSATPKVPWQKAARSVPDPRGGGQWLRIHRRGPRPAGAATRLRFGYRVRGADAVRVELANVTARRVHGLSWKPAGPSGEATLEFTGGPAAGDRVDELRFLLPRGGELVLSDVLL